MVKVFKTTLYILKRIIIGVGIMLLYYLIKGELALNTYAADTNYTVIFYHSVSGCNVTCNTNTFCNLNFTGSCANGGINRISLKSRYNILQNGSQYELYTTLILGQNTNSLNIRSDVYTGNFQATTWNGASNVTWNHLDGTATGSNGYYNLTWGLVQKFTSSISSNGFTFDFYFNSAQKMNYFEIKRFDLVTTGSSTGDAINNQTNAIINNNNNNTQQIINNQNSNTQQIISSNQQLHNDNQQINQSINNSSYSDVGADVQSLEEQIGADFTTNTPISDLITMPFTLLNAYSNGISSSCSSFNLGSLYGTDIIFPCIYPQNYLGSSLWGVIDLLFCIFLVYNIAMLVVHIYDSITSLDSGFESLYTPKHADTGYTPKHGGGS